MIIDEEVYLEHYLKHYGVLGMQWGVRNDKGYEGRRATTRKIARLDKRFEKKAGKYSTDKKVFEGSRERWINKLNAINDSPKYKTADFTKDSPLRREYYKEASKALAWSLSESARSLGTNPSGTREYDVVFSPNFGVGDDRQSKEWAVKAFDVPQHRQNVQGRNKVTHTNLEHANDTLMIRPIFNDLGFIIDFELVEEEMQQTNISDDGINFIKHHGVKGMKWGVRKVKVAGAAGAAAYLGVKFLSRFNLGTPVSVIAGIASAEAGAEVARMILNAQGERRPPFYG